MARTLWLFLIFLNQAIAAKCPDELTRVEVPNLGVFSAKGPFNSLFPKKVDGKQIGYSVGGMDHTFRAMGFQRGDVIVEVNGREFNTQDLMVKGMDDIVVGRTERKICIVFLRQDQRIEKRFHLVPAAKPQ